jgi:hypothetical protein
MTDPLVIFRTLFVCSKQTIVTRRTGEERRSMDKEASSDGTPIAFDRLGDGPSVIVVGGVTCNRAMTRPLSEQLAHHLPVINYARRGRGDSGDTAPYTVEREIDLRDRDTSWPPRYSYRCWRNSSPTETTRRTAAASARSMLLVGFGNPIR